jgi:hypothetical protein
MTQNPIKIGVYYYEGLNPFHNKIYISPRRLSQLGQVTFDRIVLCPSEHKYYLGSCSCSRREWLAIRSKLLRKLERVQPVLDLEELVKGLECYPI